jgi:hypothetical protein
MDVTPVSSISTSKTETTPDEPPLKKQKVESNAKTEVDEAQSGEVPQGNGEDAPSLEASQSVLFGRALQKVTPPASRDYNFPSPVFEVNEKLLVTSGTMSTSWVSVWA